MKPITIKWLGEEAILIDEHVSSIGSIDLVFAAKTQYGGVILIEFSYWVRSEVLETKWMHIGRSKVKKILSIMDGHSFYTTTQQNTDLPQLHS